MNRYQQCVALLLFIEQKKIATLKEVIEYLYPNKKKINVSTLGWVSSMAMGDGTFSFKSKLSQRDVDLDEKCLESPSDYIFEFNHLAKYDAWQAATTQPELLFTEDSKISEQYYFADVKLSEDFGLCGSKEGANTLYERVRAFTNFFANLLAQKNYKLTNSLFTNKASAKYSVEYLESFIAKQEKQVDSIKFYDNVEICSIYNGEITDPDVDLMSLPKGSKAEQRIGVSRFKLVFSHTPNGVTMFGQDIQIEILEEDGRFKVFNFYCVN